MTISHNPKGPLTKLDLKSVQVSDEDTYLCETTFIEPMESCDNTGSYSISLKVNGKVNSKSISAVIIYHRFHSTMHVYC